MDISSKPAEGHVLFWITEEDGREFATCGAAEFRAVMRERDELRIAAEMSAVDISVLIKQDRELRAEVERLRAEVETAMVEVERLRAALALHHDLLPPSYVNPACRVCGTNA